MSFIKVAKLAQFLMGTQAVLRPDQADRLIANAGDVVTEHEAEVLRSTLGIFRGELDQNINVRLQRAGIHMPIEEARVRLRHDSALALRLGFDPVVVARRAESDYRLQHFLNTHPAQSLPRLYAMSGGAWLAIGALTGAAIGGPVGALIGGAAGAAGGIVSVTLAEEID